MITKENKDKAIAKVARNKADVGSPEVQVSILTERIKEVTEHVKNNKHDFMAKRGLMQMVGKRKKLLKYLEETDFELELTWLEEHPQKYDLGECEFHLALRADDYDAAHEMLEELAAERGLKKRE